ncbi:hypothetical protein BDN72DRAFT_342963 [Pluteus cervinus]|uniref:Uncharacterized protein n=1 Tax=Pluteus cervinus TaxID=181527 RepID=A0ACD3B389_9AGAR|nr:hypothetical protein BDN72DRAFT_342963 [Pluteus cervinus]
MHSSARKGGIAGGYQYHVVQANNFQQQRLGTVRLLTIHSAPSQIRRFLRSRGICRRLGGIRTVEDLKAPPEATLATYPSPPRTPGFPLYTIYVDSGGKQTKPSSFCCRLAAGLRQRLIGLFRAKFRLLVILPNRQKSVDPVSDAQTAQPRGNQFRSPGLSSASPRSCLSRQLVVLRLWVTLPRLS